MAAERKPLFMDQTEGFSEEVATTDYMTIARLTIPVAGSGGVGIVMNSTKVTGLGAATAAGDALGYAQTGAELGDLTITSGGDIDVSGGGELTGLPTVPSLSTSATSKAYVDSLVSGLGWKNPVDVFRLVGNQTVAQLDALGANAGAAYVVTDAGTLTRGTVAVTAGDLVEDNGTIWVLIEDAVGGFVPAGIRAILSGTDTLVSPYTDGTDNDKIVEFSGSSNTGVDTGDTVDKAAVLIQDSAHIGFYDNNGYVYEGVLTAGEWVQFTGTGTIIAGDGLVKTGNTISVDLATDPGLQFTSNKLDTKLKALGALAKDANGLYVKVEADGAITIDGTGGGLQVELEASNPSLAIVTNELGVKLSDGLTKDANGTAVALDASGSALEFTGAAGDGTLGVKVEATNPTLAVDGSNQLGVKLDPARAITTGAAGIGVNLEATNPALAITTNALDVKYQTTKGLASDASGLYVKVDGTSVSFDGSGQLQSLGSAEASRVENDMNGTGGTVAAGDPVYYTATANIIDEADAAVNAESRVIGVCRDATTITALAIVSAGPCAGVLSGATAGTPYYLQSGGGIGTALPGASTRVVQVGIAMNATDLFVRIVDFGKKAA